MILLDLGMPIMDGWALLEELRRRPNLGDIPVIVLSAALWDQTRIDGLGTLAFLPKPCDLDALVATIREAIDAPETGTLEAFPVLSTDEHIPRAPVTESPARGESRR